MPHLIDTYATASGFKIDQPYLYQQFFPVPFKKYILFHAGGNQPAKHYDFYGEVVALVRSTVREHGYELLQIGGNDDPQVPNVIDLRGKTNIHHTGYLIRQASLLVGNDSCNVHFASGFNIPIVALYGSTAPKNHGAYFGDKSKQILLEADRKGKKPTFNANEPERTINTIKPETVAQAIFDLLKIDKKVNIETLHVGPQYNNFVVEAVMDTVIKPDFFEGAVFNVRLDYLFNEEILAKCLSLRSLCVLTNKPINIEILKRFKKNVATVIYDVDENYSVEFVKQMLDAAIPYQMITFLEGEQLSQAKLAFFDYGIVIKRKRITYNSLENAEKIIKYKDNLKFKTRKFLLSDNKIFLHKGDWINQKPIENFMQNTGTVPFDDADFWQESEFYYIYHEET